MANLHDNVQFSNFIALKPYKLFHRSFCLYNKLSLLRFNIMLCIIQDITFYLLLASHKIQCFCVEWVLKIAHINPYSVFKQYKVVSL